MTSGNDSFHGSVYGRRRRRRSPLAALGWVVFYASSLAPAVWIAWRYDLIGRVDRRLQGAAAPQSTNERIPAPSTQQSTSSSPIGEERPPAEPAFDDSVEDVARGQVRASRRAPQTRRTPLAANEQKAPQVVPEPTIAHSIDVDLTARRQRFPLPKGAGAAYRIVSLRGCPAPYDLAPRAAAITDRDAAVVVIAGPREVRLRVKLQQGGPGGRVIVLEPSARTDDGDEIPFTLEAMENIRQRVVKLGGDASDELAAIEAEGARLVAWINSRTPKPLADVGQAKARVAALQVAQQRQMAKIKALEADLAVAEAMEGLARELHEEAVLDIAEPDP